MMPLVNTEKKGLAQGMVAEMTLTWQASIDMTCSLTMEAVGLALKTLECMGRSREALGAIRSRRKANAMTTLAFVFTGMLMCYTKWTAPASKANSKIQDETAVASLWPHCARSVSRHSPVVRAFNVLDRSRRCAARCPTDAGICTERLRRFVLVASTWSSLP